MADARPIRDPAVRRLQVERERARREAIERGLDVDRRRIVPRQEELLDRARAIEHLPEDPQQRNDVRAARPPVDEAGKRRRLAPRVEPADVVGRAIARDRNEPLDRLQDARDAAERQRGRAEADDFTIVGPLEATDDLDRVGSRVRAVEVSVQLVERELQ